MKFHGLSVSPGVALAPAYVYRPATIHAPRESIAPEQIPAELARYAEGRAAAAEQLKTTYDSLSKDAPDKAAIFQAHLEILQDVAMVEEIETLISEARANAADAVETVYTQYADLIGALEDPLMRERAADLVDVRTRLLCCLLHIRSASLAEILQPSVVVAHELLPSDTAIMDAGMVRAILTEEGGTTSHAAILARSLGIPAVSGLSAVMEQVEDGQLLAVNAAEGTVESNLDADTLRRYEVLLLRYQQDQATEKTFLHLEPVTKQGEYVQVCLNIGSDQDPALAYAGISDGVGLFRSEFLYMQSSALPDEEAQARAYTKVAKCFGNKQVVIRTLDIGGDKQIPAIPMRAEANPFLGCRALRLCFDREDLFQTQLRAILRAACHGNLAVMFPMVGSMEDLQKAKAALERARQSLEAEGLPYRAGIPVGVMIEIPAIAIMAQQVAQEVDFASLGTNDLCQYLLAADRMNPQVAGYYQPFHPALFRLICHVQACFRSAGKPLSVCGEMGANPLAVLGLMSLGVRKFSMNPGAVASIKRLIRNVDEPQLQQAAQILRTCSTAERVEAGLQTIINRTL